MAEWGARYIKKRIHDFNPSPDRLFILGLPTGMSYLTLLIDSFSFFIGSTPVGTYKKLIEFVNAKELSFKYVVTFNMDEYVGLPRVGKNSFFFVNNFIYKESS
jgi:glucosamine-6-phosphate deaminase